MFVKDETSVLHPVRILSAGNVVKMEHWKRSLFSRPWASLFTIHYKHVFTQMVDEPLNMLIPACFRWQIFTFCLIFDKRIRWNVDLALQMSRMSTSKGLCFLWKEYMSSGDIFWVEPDNNSLSSHNESCMEICFNFHPAAISIVRENKCYWCTHHWEQLHFCLR